MKRIFIYIITIAIAAGCNSHRISNEDIRIAETTLSYADSLENTVTIYADTAALQNALHVFHMQKCTAETAKTQYHLGNAYKAVGEDSLAFLAYAQAADMFLTLSDSVYYPLSVLEMSLIAEQQYKEDGNSTMLQAIRHLQSEMIRDRKEHHRWQWTWWLILIVIIMIGSILFVYFLRKRKPSIVAPISREDLERNIELVLSQGNIQTTLQWRDYEQFCRTSNAYLYNVVDKLQIEEQQLKEQDIRFLVLVLLDLPAKEIADIMNLSQYSISNKKTRTAQKLGTIAADLRETIISLILKTTEQ